MIRLPPQQTIPDDIRFGLSVVGDCSRLLRSELPEAVELRISAGRTAAERLDGSAQIRAHDGVVEVSESALRLVTRIVGVADEQRSMKEDRFGRVPPGENLLARQGLERDPVVARFAMALRTAAVEAAGRRRVALVAPWPEGKRWALAMTHDLDVVALWPVFTALRLAELARKGRFGDALTVAGGALAAVAASPVERAVLHILETERRLGIRSTWFVITGTPSFGSMRAGDVTYVPESPRARRIMEQVLGGGHEIGLHGSFETWTHAERFQRQRERLERIAGKPVTGVRQHFLRMRPGQTHQAMQAAGFQYDSTYGFADRNGFRIGMADAAPAWEESLGRALSLETVPFVWMDRALSKYRGIEDPRVLVDDALALARVVREIEGVWTGIWHPNLSRALGYPGAEQAFGRLCEQLMGAGDAPWAAPLGEIVEWRRHRRAVRAVASTAAGEIVLGSDGPGPVRVALEDASGRAIASRVA